MENKEITYEITLKQESLDNLYYLQTTTTSTDNEIIEQALKHFANELKKYRYMYLYR